MKFSEKKSCLTRTFFFFPYCLRYKNCLFYLVISPSGWKTAQLLTRNTVNPQCLNVSECLLGFAPLRQSPGSSCALNFPDSCGFPPDKLAFYIALVTIIMAKESKTRNLQMQKATPSHIAHFKQMQPNYSICVNSD